MHLDLVKTVTGTRFTSSALYVKAEPSVLISSLLGIGCSRIESSYKIEYADICGGVRSGSPSDRRLVDNDDLVEIAVSLNVTALYLSLSRSVKLMRENGYKSRIDKRALT